MVKLRMNTADVAAEVKCLRSLIGMRCANVYDLSAKTYIFKLMKSSGVTESGESEKVLLLVESGIRFHTTAFARDKSSTPSGFTLKLRKHIRTKRLEEVRQLGMDRVVDFQFGLGEGAYHIILELYAQGNLLLTDGGYNVLTLLRTHRDDEKGLTMMAHHEYPVGLCRTWERTSFEKLEAYLIATSVTENCKPQEDSEQAPKTVLVDDVSKQARKRSVMKEKTNQKQDLSGKKNESTLERDKGTLKNILGENLGYGPTLCEHIVLDAGLPINLRVFSKDNNGLLISNMTKEQILQLHSAVNNFENWLEEVVSRERIPEGFILLKKKEGGNQQPLLPENQSKIYDEFSPLLLKQYSKGEHVKMPTFNDAMDEFFSKIEGQRAEQQRKTQEYSAFQKLEKIRKDQENRVESLKKEVDHSVSMAELIEYNLEDVDAAILAVRTALATGMSWKDLTRMVKEERKAGNPVASIIHSLQLEKDQITLLLCNNLDDMDEEEKTQPAMKVEVDLSLSAHANARRWFEAKKKQLAKQVKTVAAHEKAFKAAERKTQQQLAQEKVVAAISHIRKVHWFEKFNWFISSENYLIISGRDAPQNELLVKRYLKKGDLYVHADLHGASSTVIKNHDPKSAVPPLTLNQAGCFTVCRSQAWDSKIVTSAWWVYAYQVSKTAPTGEYLTMGSFMIRGKKNFLPPHPLVMGFGILFRLEESCVAAHRNDRRHTEDTEEQEEQHQEKEQEEQDEEEEEKEEEEEEEKAEGADKEEEKEKAKLETQDGIGFSDVNEQMPRKEKEINQSSQVPMPCQGPFSANNNNEEASQIDTHGNEPSKLGIEIKKLDTSTATNYSADFDELMDKAFELPTHLRLDKPSMKYGLDSYPNGLSSGVVSQTNSEDKVADKVMQRQRPYLSKVERRKVKKGFKDGDTEEKTEMMTEMGTDRQEDDSDKETSTSCQDQAKRENPLAGRSSRGRKGKLKKIKEKYAEQDEEERELRMALLASAGRHGADKKVQQKVEQAKSSTHEVESQLKVCYKCKRSGHVAKDCPFTANTGSPDLNMVQSKHSDEKEGLASTEGDESLLELAEDEKEKLTELDLLTGKPFTHDILLYAVPVCGPYNALQGYKYRVKLTPGSSKRGKAAKTAMNVFMHMQEATSREKDLMKAITDPELVAAMIGNAKVTAPGLSQLKHQQKKGKKGSVDND